MNETLAVTSESFNYDKLLVTGSGFPIVTDSVTVLSGAKLLRGTVVGIVTENGKAVVCDSSKTDGSQIPHGILAQDIDATAADMTGLIYLTGEFNANALIFGGSDTKTTMKVALRRATIFIKGSV